MKHTIITHTKENQALVIDIRLSDPCKNGHNDFAITAARYKRGTKTFSDRNI